MLDDNQKESFDIGYVVFVVEEYISHSRARFFPEIFASFPHIDPCKFSRYVMSYGEDHDYIGLTHSPSDGCPTWTWFCGWQYKPRNPALEVPLTFALANRWVRRPVIRGPIDVAVRSYNPYDQVPLHVPVITEE